MIPVSETGNKIQFCVKMAEEKKITLTCNIRSKHTIFKHTLLKKIKRSKQKARKDTVVTFISV